MLPLGPPSTKPQAEPEKTPYEPAIQSHTDRETDVRVNLLLINATKE